MDLQSSLMQEHELRTKLRANRQEVGERLRAARAALGLTQDELGQQIGVNQRTLAAYENGVRVIPPLRLLALADALGVPVDDLIS